MPSVAARERRSVPEEARSQLLPIARRVFWWGKPEEWLEDIIRFTAQVMTYGDWNDVALTIKLLSEDVFRETLDSAPAGIFDIKSWTFWHNRYNREVPPLPTRKL